MMTLSCPIAFCEKKSYHGVPLTLHRILNHKVHFNITQSTTVKQQRNSNAFSLFHIPPYTKVLLPLTSYFPLINRNLVSLVFEYPSYIVFNMSLRNIDIFLVLFWLDYFPIHVTWWANRVGMEISNPTSQYHITCWV